MGLRTGLRWVRREFGYCVLVLVSARVPAYHTLLVARQTGHSGPSKPNWLGAGATVCAERHLGLVSGSYLALGPLAVATNTREGQPSWKQASLARETGADGRICWLCGAAACGGSSTGEIPTGVESSLETITEQSERNCIAVRYANQGV